VGDLAQPFPSLGFRALSLVLFAMFLVVGARAQGSGAIYVPDDIPGRPSPFTVTRIAKGKIAAIHKGEHETIVLFEDAKGRRGALMINSKTQFKADRNTEFGPKKHLSAADLEIGQNVKITFAANTGNILELRFTAKT
jgi:hypothetical protein